MPFEFLLLNEFKAIYIYISAILNDSAIFF